GAWTVDRIRGAGSEFLRRLTIEARYEKGHGLRRMTKHWNGELLQEVEQEFQRSPQWREFEEELLAVAEEQSDTIVPDCSAPPIAGSEPLGGVADRLDTYSTAASIIPQTELTLSESKQVQVPDLPSLEPTPTPQKIKAQRIGKEPTAEQRAGAERLVMERS